MKKLITALSFLPLIGSAIAVQFMPDKVPMHYDLSGNTDRWGSKYEFLLISGIFLPIMFIFIVMIDRFEKKAKNAPSDKDRASAEANRKVAVCLAFAALALFAGIFAHSIYKAISITDSGVSKLEFDDLKFTSLLMGVLFIVLGNLCAKTKRNSGIGLRLSWTEYNDVTWSKSNRFAGKAMCLAGVLCIVSTAFSKGIVSILLMLLYLLAVVIVSSVYAHRIYLCERSKTDR